MRNRKFQKNTQKNQKIPLWHQFKTKQVGKGSKRENKNYRFVSFRSDPTHKRKFKNKIAKKFNKLKDSVMASFQAKIGWKRPRKRKNKNCLSVPFLPDR